MPVLTVAVVLVGVVGLVNLLFAFGVIRRLREHTEILNSLSGAQAVILPPGRTVATYRSTTVDGRPVGSDEVDSPTLVAFFSTTCEACRVKLPGFLERAAQHAGGREAVLAVVVAESDQAAEPLVADLVGVARVVREPDRGPLQLAFAVGGFPVFALISPDGTVVASGLDVPGPVSVSAQHA